MEKKVVEKKRHRIKFRYVLLLVWIILGLLIYFNWDTFKEKATEVALKDILDSPGGCSSQEECLDYCITNQEECLQWCLNNPRFCDPIDAVEIPAEGGPGGCRTEEDCLEYCTRLENEKECKEFLGIE